MYFTYFRISLSSKIPTYYKHPLLHKEKNKHFLNPNLQHYTFCLYLTPKNEKHVNKIPHKIKIQFFTITYVGGIFRFSTYNRNKKNDTMYVIIALFLRIYKTKVKFPNRNESEKALTKYNKTYFKLLFVA